MSLRDNLYQALGTRAIVVKAIVGFGLFLGFVGNTKMITLRDTAFTFPSFCPLFFPNLQIQM